MIGAIAGDIIGSVYEHYQIKTKDFPLFHPQCCFTDDSVLTIAVAKAILDDRNYLKAVWEIGRRYPHAGYGGSFIGWLHSSEPRPYNSWGNGAAMRVSPVGFAFETAETVLREAACTAEISHNHPVGDRFGYDLDRTVEHIRPSYGFDISCQGTVPEAIIAFLDSDSYEDAIRNAISLGGDSDTLACITGGIAEAYYGAVAPFIIQKVKECLTEELWTITESFCRKYATERSNTRVQGSSQ
jgi:ADP-ribosylglycohydrolase